MTADLIPLHLTEKWAEVVQGVKEKAQDDAKSTPMTSRLLSAAVQLEMTYSATRARSECFNVCDKDGLSWLDLADEYKAALILHYNRAYIEAIQSRFEEIVRERRSRSDA